MRFDDRGAARERAVDHGVEVFGVELLAQRGRADHVEEQDADLLERLPAGFSRDGRGQAVQLRAQGCECLVDERIAQQHPLRLERTDSGFELLAFSGHASGRAARWSLWSGPLPLAWRGNRR